LPVVRNGTLALGFAIGLSGFGCFAQGVPPPVEQVSADCAAPVYATDQLVCSDASLRNLEAQLLWYWSTAESMHLLGEADRSPQTDWFRIRSQRAFSADHRACAVAAYHGRIAVLRALLAAY
jgi:uncharacterized protein